VMVVDAPCSGSGLFRRDEEAIDEWSPNNVVLCSQRQQRILADALPALKENGILIYATCSYSPEEDEDIADWLVQNQNMENIRLTINESWCIIESKAHNTGAYGYRFYPDKVKGEGFFLACFRKKSSAGIGKNKSARMEKATVKEAAILKSWIKEEGFSFLKMNHEFYAVPDGLLSQLEALQPHLYIVYAGVHVGEVLRDKLLPAHALALSTVLASSVTVLELTYEEAIRYLQRGELGIIPEKKGWQVVSYKKHNLGWINALSNRINNYYPKELRILKQQNNSAL
ncbi:MAG: hypothetical protein ICV53_24110, partial [Flavisolibacter sp.]|nr:hypothetical protein [Flavisolibacter sp.]